MIAWWWLIVTYVIGIASGLWLAGIVIGHTSKQATLWEKTDRVG